MEPRNLAQWMHNEHESVRALSDKLREKVAIVPRVELEDWLTQVRNRFAHLRAHLHQHMALEERDGYLPSVVEARPTLSGQVNRLKHEHIEITRIMDGIRRELDDVVPADSLMIRDVCDRIQNLLSYLEHHENDENLMVMTVMTDDIGSKD